MKLLVVATLVVTLSLVSGELLQMLKLLNDSDSFRYLSDEEKIFLVEVVAAAEACKLTPLVNVVGMDAITRLIIHLPGDNEYYGNLYVTDHLSKEERGTCIVDATAPPPPTTPSGGVVVGR